MEEYMIALLNEGIGQLTPVCLVLDGPLIHCAPSEPVDGSGQVVQTYRVDRKLAIHQRAVSYLLDSAHQCLLSMTGAGSVAMLGNFPLGPALRTALRCTSIFIASKVRLVAEKNQVGSAFLCGHHDIDIDGDIKLILDPSGSSLYLLQGTLFLDGKCAARTGEHTLVENIYLKERQLKQEYPVSPAVIQRTQLLNTLNVQKEEVSRVNPDPGKQKEPLPTEQQSHQQIKSHAFVVHQSLKSRFVFSSFIPVNQGEQQHTGKQVVGVVQTNFNAGRPMQKAYALKKQTKLKSKKEPAKSNPNPKSTKVGKSKLPKGKISAGKNDKSNSAKKEPKSKKQNPKV